MDASKTSAFSLNLPHLLSHRNSVPDVPEDVDFVMQHLNDPNYDLRHLSSDYSDSSFDLDEKKDIAFSSGFSERSSDIDTESQTESTGRSTRVHLRGVEENLEEDSPYPEVRAAVSNVDDPSMPVNTFRTWFLGLFFTIIVSAINHFIEFRGPSVWVSPLIVQLIALPSGKLLEWALPTKRFNTFGYVWSLNPGPFNIKEHTVITIMANAISQDVYVTAVFASQRAFYNQSISFGYQILLALSTQLFGYAISGMVRQFLVWPAAMIWPGALVDCALLTALHKNYGKKETKHISRERFFLYAMIASATYYFLPGYLFTALSIFNWVCWIAPQNQTVNTLFGTNTGLGMGILTFDWAQISWIGSPLVSPFWATANMLAGFVLFFWIVAPIVYFTNGFYSQFMPISSSETYDNTGMPYDVTRVLTNGVFDEAKYKAYSPLYMSATFAVSYGVQFAGFLAVVVHTIIWYRYDIISQFRRSVKDERDVHSRLMSVYPEVPKWWYAILGLVAFIFGVVAIEIYPTELPVWALLFALVIALIFTVPVGLIRAITNQTIGLNVLAEFIVGYILPGRPVAMMLFKTYGFVTVTQALSLTSDQKMGHYMKIPPKIMFMAQAISSIVAAFVCVGIQQWMFANIEDFCLPTQKDHFTCPSVSTFSSASIIWGGIGPQRVFSAGALYNPILYFFIIGGLSPIPLYMLARRYPLSFWRYVNMPLFLGGLGQLPPANGLNYISWAVVGFIFMFYIRRTHFRWWIRFNYILSAAMDSGTAIALILIFFCLQFPKDGININWWGNTVWINTFDAIGMPRQLPTGPNGTFGPTVFS